MTTFYKATILSTVFLAGAAIAHSDISKVQNEAVKARMMAMSTIGKNVKTLGMMAKGGAPFDSAKAAAAAAAIAGQAHDVPSLFEAEETDPESEAKPEIWTNYADFTTKAEAMLAAAESFDSSSLDTLKASLGKLGGTCNDCHKEYRLEN